MHFNSQQAEYGEQLNAYKDVSRFRSPGEAYIKAKMNSVTPLKV